ncbi:hypothetical protein LSTR_LSTR006267 [Laodelphax striatellus]|uniref:Major facilitator superfamily (MFS) profile domain-containing protein n=1 Tax=Laodelphax striatellus TaxID=195883 RepID=A0A482WQB9_LAOST|nr:hypothetical protein LSTR_LSTR006267 [Laodelphax striatellus]
MFTRVNFFRNQYCTGFAANATILLCGSCFVWVTPLLPRLTATAGVSRGVAPLLAMTPTQQSWLVALYEVGALIAPIPAGRLADKTGRRVALITGMPLLLFSWLAVLSFRSVAGFYAARLLQGTALGFLATAAGIYISEISSAHARGAMTSLQQGMWYSGFLLQYVTGSYLRYETNVHVNLTLTVLLFIYLLIFPLETPYHLVKIGQQERALESLMVLRGKRMGDDLLETHREMSQIVESVEMEQKTEKVVWKDLIKTKADRRILLVTQFLTAARILCGSISVSTYINVLLNSDQNNLDSTKTSTNVTTIIYGSVTLVTIITASFLVDIVGRRPLLLISSAGAFIANVGCALYFYHPPIFNNFLYLNSSKILPLPVLLTSLTFFFSIGLGPVTQTVQSELLPSHTRGLGNVVSLVNVTLTGLITLRCYQVVVDMLGVYANFMIYAVVCALCFVFVAIFVPETRGKSLLEIRRYFIDESRAKVQVTKF